LGVNIYMVITIARELSLLDTTSNCANLCIYPGGHITKEYRDSYIKKYIEIVQAFLKDPLNKNNSSKLFYPLGYVNNEFKMVYGEYATVDLIKRSVKLLEGIVEGGESPENLEEAKSLLSAISKSCKTFRPVG